MDFANRYAPPLSVSRPELLDDSPNGLADDRFREAIYTLFMTANGFQSVREAFGREIGASGSQYFILMAIARGHARGGIGIRSIADHLGVAASHVTVEVGKLIAKGLIAKRPNPQDRRRVLITLTPAGKAALDRLAPLRQRINDILFDGFSREEFGQLHGFLHRFARTTARAQHEVALHENLRNAAEEEGKHP